MRLIARLIVVHGRVQGVFFRNWTVAAARELGIRGWVRNRSGGDVEIFAEGPPEAVAALAERCRTGPPAAAVERVEVEEAEPESLATFEKRPTV